MRDHQLAEAGREHHSRGGGESRAQRAGQGTAAGLQGIDDLVRFPSEVSVMYRYRSESWLETRAVDGAGWAPHAATSAAAPRTTTSVAAEASRSMRLPQPSAGHGPTVTGLPPTASWLTRREAAAAGRLVVTASICRPVIWPIVPVSAY